MLAELALAVQGQEDCTVRHAENRTFSVISDSAFVIKPEVDHLAGGFLIVEGHLEEGLL